MRLGINRAYDNERLLTDPHNREWRARVWAFKRGSIVGLHDMDSSRVFSVRITKRAAGGHYCGTAVIDRMGRWCSTRYKVVFTPEHIQWTRNPRRDGYALPLVTLDRIFATPQVVQ